MKAPVRTAGTKARRVLLVTAALSLFALAMVPSPGTMAGVACTWRRWEIDCMAATAPTTSRASALVILQTPPPPPPPPSSPPPLYTDDTQSLLDALAQYDMLASE